MKKYLLLLLLIANLTAEYVVLMPISSILFYGTLILSVPVVLGSKIFTIKTYRSCPHIYWLALIYVIYFFTLGFQYIGKDSSFYLVGKCATYCIILLGLRSNYEFYFKTTVRPMSYVMLGLLLLGIVVHPFDYGGNLSFGYANRNAASAISTIAFFGFLFSSEKLKGRNLVCLSMCLIIVLLGGSRNSLAMCIIGLMVRFGLSLKLVLVIAGLLFAFVVVLPNMGVDVLAFDRLLGTISGEVSLDRELQREAARWMIDQRPITGWGFEAQMTGYAKELSEYGSHNGYLDHIIFMGKYFGITWIVVMLLGFIKRLKLYFQHDNYINYHIAVMVSVLLAAGQEAYLVGVNQVITNLFFVSFILLGLYPIKKK